MTNPATLARILKRNKLSVTASREKILQLFYENEGALAHGDIEKAIGESVDRVTVYRTLQVFVEKGIIHTIPTSDNSIRYALCKGACEEGHHHDHHIHFVCQQCKGTFCLDEIATPAVSLPKGYQVAQIEMVVQGLCAECSGY